MANKKSKELSFEEALNKLEEISDELRSGDASLEESIEMFNKSVEYYNICKTKLESAKQKIEMFDPETGEVIPFEEQ